MTALRLSLSIMEVSTGTQGLGIRIRRKSLTECWNDYDIPSRHYVLVEGEDLLGSHIARIFIGLTAQDLSFDGSLASFWASDACIHVPRTTRQVSRVATCYQTSYCV